MGFVKEVKDIIAKFREKGKKESEISRIIKTAAEKATVNREHLKKDEFPKTEIEKRRITNNWRRMHGLPMRRKQKERERNER